MGEEKYKGDDINITSVLNFPTDYRIVSIMITLDSISKSFGGTYAVKDISLL